MDKSLSASQQVGNSRPGRPAGPWRPARPSCRPGTVAGVTATRSRRAWTTDEDASPALVSTGVASLAVRDVLRGPRRAGKVLAALPYAIYLEFTDPVPEPRVIAISASDALRLPNAIITGPWEARAPQDGWAGEDRVLACGLDLRIMRWWDPSPVFGPLSRARPGACSAAAQSRAWPATTGRSSWRPAAPTAI